MRGTDGAKKVKMGLFHECWEKQISITMRKVTILHGTTTEYRVPFFKELNRILEIHGIALKVVIGNPSKYEIYGPIEGLDCFHFVNNRYIYFGKKYFVWEPVFKHLYGNDMVIMRQAKKHLTNPLVFLYCKLKSIKIGLWGNMKSYFGNHKKSNAPLIWKVDRWFAYNELTKRLVEKTGYPSSQITSINNSIDTRKEREYYLSMDNNAEILRKKYKIDPNDIVGIFCSRLYEAKRIDFLLDAIELVKVKIRNFKFIVVGDGIDAQKIRDFEQKHPDWFIWAGSQYGKNKVDHFRLATFQLMPGMVGLHIVDSFAFETPIITTENDYHSVEIGYLENHYNGIIAKNTLEEYTNVIIDICQNPQKIKELRAGCIETSKVYTVENMAKNFAEGIIKCLNK